MPYVRLTGRQIEEMFDVTQPPSFVEGDMVRRIDEDPDDEKIYKVIRLRQNAERAWMALCRNAAGATYSWYAARFIPHTLPHTPQSLVKRIHKSHPTNHRIGVPKNKLP